MLIFFFVDLVRNFVDFADGKYLCSEREGHGLRESCHKRLFDGFSRLGLVPEVVNGESVRFFDCHKIYCVAWLLAIGARFIIPPNKLDTQKR